MEMCDGNLSHVGGI